MVVFEQGVPNKKQYRHFRIKTVEGANDFASMEEVLRRRFTHGLEERKEREAERPAAGRRPFFALPRPDPDRRRAAAARLRAPRDARLRA